MKTTVINKKWWGWGLENKTYGLEHRPDFLPFLRDCLESELAEEFKPVRAEAVKLPPVKLDSGVIAEFAEILGKENLSTEHSERLLHAYGKSYRDLVRIRKGDIEFCHDIVLFPRSHQDLVKIIETAGRHNISLVPFGGGSSVVGGVEVKKEQKTACIDLSRNMTKLLGIDKQSLLATFQAGVMGPELEKILNERGFSLSHYPQSFEFSTLGGWVAARSAGQQSTKYGKIEKLVTALKMISPNGEIETRKLPAKATGPDINQIIIGSEGIFGIISEVTVKIHPLPELKDYRGYLFENFSEGIRFIKEIIHDLEIYPATVRLSDETETKLLFKLGEKRHSYIKDKINDLVKTYIREVRHFSFDNMCLLLLGFEGIKEKVHFDQSRINEILKGYKVVSLGKSIGDRWYESRFDLPYLRDALLDKGVLVDTLETSTIWSNFANLYKVVQESLKSAIGETGRKGLVGCHISHIYPEGASLYYTFVTKQNLGQELEQWQIIKNKVTDNIVEHQGAISHHHGIGADHAGWLPGEIGETGMQILKGIKEKLDPDNLMNPQNLLSEPQIRNSP
jgi:alkyldihydroxyacetonephosphate synthase